MFSQLASEERETTRSMVFQMGRVKRSVFCLSFFEGCFDTQDIWPNIQKYIDSDQAIVFKDDHAAKIVSFSVDGKRYIIKQYKPRCWHKALRRAWGRSRAHIAWNKALLLQENAIPIGQPMAWMEDRIGIFCIRSFFIARELPGITAREYLQARELVGEEVRNALTCIVRSLMCMHDRGICYGDTKDTNIIFQNDKITWVDYDAVSKGQVGTLRFRRQKKDWQILQYNWRDMPRIHRTFLDVLGRHCSHSEYLNLIKSFVVYNQKKMRTHPQGLMSGQAQRGLPSASEVLKKFHENSLNKSWQKVRSSQTALVLRLDHGNSALYCKIFFPRSRWDVLKSLFRRSRCQRAVHNKQLLRTAGFNVAEVASWDHKNGIGVMITKEVKGERLDTYLGKPKNVMTDEEKKRHSDLMYELGKQAGYLHACGFGHGDLRLSNILVNFDANRPVLYFFDNERTKFYGRVPERVIVKNLTQINVDSQQRISATDRLRIFRAYQHTAGAFGSRKKQRKIIRKIMQRTEKRLNCRKQLYRHQDS